MEVLPRGEELDIPDCWPQRPPPPRALPCPATTDNVICETLSQPPAPMSLQVTLFFWASVSRLSGNRSPGLSCPELEVGLSL